MPFEHQYNNEPTLYVIAVISNPRRFSVRYQLYKEFEQRMLKEPNVKLITVEHAFGERPFEVTDSKNPYHVQLRGGPEYEIWLKEAMINRAFRHLYEKHPNWKYAAWIDADIEFTRDTWVQETIEALQHHRVVQPWSHAIDLGPLHEVMQKPARSFASCFVEGIPPKTKYGGEHWHPGYAWAIRRDAMDGLVRLIDWTILGSGDNYMAHAFAGNIWKTGANQFGVNYKKFCHDFQVLCNQYIEKDIGFVPGTILHYFHGAKKNRQYVDRTKILTSNNFDPVNDIAYDAEGIPFLVGNKLGLRDGIRQYFAQRNEDSIDWQ